MPAAAPGMSMDAAPLRFGGVFGGSRGIETARTLERLGFDFVADGEHVMRGMPPQPSDAALVSLAAVAGATAHVRLLAAAVLTPLYHPVWLAKLATTVDVVSGGRLTLGIGVGGEHPKEFAALGVPVKERGARTDECLEALRRLWTQDHVVYRGRHFSFEDVSIVPRPVQRPHPPIWVTGRKESAMRRAARLGDGWLPMFYTPKQYSDSVSRIRAFADRSGRDLTGFGWGVFLFGTMDPSREESARIAAAGLGKNFLSGDRGWAAMVGAYCLLGSAHDWIVRLREYVDAGARHFLIGWLGRPEDQDRLIRATAEEVIPALRAEERRRAR